MNTLKLNEKTVQEILDYLSVQPYKEVYIIINKIMLEATESKKQQESESKQ
jgi:hypothetical protein